MASDGAANDGFGGSVAVDGDTAVVGAVGSDRGGSAFVFVRSGDAWVQAAKLTASDAANYDRFGASVAIGEGYVIVGASGTDGGGDDEGSAYVFFGSEDAWEQVAELKADDAAGDDWFGASVAIDGDFVIVGASRDDLSGANEGSAYVFRK